MAFNIPLGVSTMRSAGPASRGRSSWLTVADLAFELHHRESVPYHGADSWSVGWAASGAVGDDCRARGGYRQVHSTRRPAWRSDDGCREAVARMVLAGGVPGRRTRGFGRGAGRRGRRRPDRLGQGAGRRRGAGVDCAGRRRRCRPARRRDGAALGGVPRRRRTRRSAARRRCGGRRGERLRGDAAGPGVRQRRGGDGDPAAGGGGRPEPGPRHRRDAGHDLRPDRRGRGGDGPPRPGRRPVGDRDRGEPRGSAPPTPPCVRVRTRRFDGVKRHGLRRRMRGRAGRRRRWAARYRAPG